MILTAVTLLIQLLPGILSSVGVISPAISNLISQLGGAIPGLITALSTKQPVPAEIITILTAFQGEIAALQTSTNLDPNDLQLAASLNSALTLALAAYTAAGKTDDPSTLTPLPTNL